MVIILDIEVLHPASDIPGVIGNPVAFNEGKSSEHILKYIFFSVNVYVNTQTQLLHLNGHNDPNQDQEKLRSAIHHKVAHFLRRPSLHKIRIEEPEFIFFTTDHV